MWRAPQNVEAAGSTHRGNVCNEMHPLGVQLSAGREEKVCACAHAHIKDGGGRKEQEAVSSRAWRGPAGASRPGRKQARAQLRVP